MSLVSVCFLFLVQFTSSVIIPGQKCGLTKAIKFIRALKSGEDVGDRACAVVQDVDSFRDQQHGMSTRLNVLSAVQLYCSRISVGLLSYDSMLALLSLDWRKKKDICLCSHPFCSALQLYSSCFSTKFFLQSSCNKVDLLSYDCKTTDKRQQNDWMGGKKLDGLLVSLLSYNSRYDEITNKWDRLPGITLPHVNLLSCLYILS